MAHVTESLTLTVLDDQKPFRSEQGEELVEALRASKDVAKRAFLGGHKRGARQEWMARRMLAWQWRGRHLAEQRARHVHDLENSHVSAVYAHESDAV